MSVLDQLHKSWNVRTTNTSEIQRRIWDQAAEHYKENRIPTFETDYFLKEMTSAIALNATVHTLDIGCGAGGYSIALAQRVNRAVGVDISPNMIAYANRCAQTMGFNNALFHCMDWSAADIDSLGFRKAFDVVFAHMTPAIADFSTFDKLNSCSRNLCMLEKPTRRKNQIQDEAFRLVGMDPSEDQHHGNIPQVFTYLWYSGYCPRFFYHDEVWVNKKTTEDMVQWVTDRARLQKALTPEEEAAIYHYIQSLALDGMVQEHTTTTKVLVIWHVN